ncbi:ubiquitin carboxyl-terminal hydrolase 4-like [Branchiostoma floridae x Branchiostoma belcheri]
MTFAMHMLEKEVGDQKVNTMPAIMDDFGDSLFDQPMDLMDCMPAAVLDSQATDQLTGPQGGQAGETSAEAASAPDVTAGPSAHPSGNKNGTEVEWEQGACGLHNLGNTCFMNAGLQCMLSNAQLCSFILDAPPGSIPEDSLCGLFAALVHKVWSGRYSYLKPRRFKDRLGHQFPQFKGFRQHDGQEFLALLLDSLHEELNKTHKLVQKNRVPMVTPADHDCAIYEDNYSSEESKSSVTSMDVPSPTSNLLVLDGGSSFHTEKCAARTVPNFEEYLMKDTKTLNTNLQTTYTLNNEKSVKSPPRVESLCHRKVHNTADESNKVNKDTNVMAEKQGNCSTQGACCGELQLKGQNINNKRLKVDCALSLRCGPIEDEQKRRATDFISNISNNQLTMPGCQGTKCKVTSNFMSKNEVNPTREVLNRMGVSMEGVKGGEAVHGEEVSKLEMSECLEESEADLEWEMYVRDNQSVVVDTFQGQFKSTVTCSVCRHPSVTYEPFMYLSVPLPRATERQIAVTWVPCDDTTPVRYCLTVQEYGKVSDLKMALLVFLGDGQQQDMIVLAEVFDHHISRTLDDGTLLRYVNTTNRDICAFQVTELRPGPDTHSDTSSTCTQATGCTGAAQDSQGQAWGGLRVVSTWRSCAVCLEEMADNQLLSHDPGCGCCLCDNCMELTSKHYLSSGFQCPVCCISVDPSLVFRRLVSCEGTKADIRIVQIPVMFRSDYVETGQEQMRLFGYPRLLVAPSEVTGTDVYSSVQQILSLDTAYSVLLTDGQGLHCSRCMFSVHCSGCEVPREGPTSLKPGDHLTVRLTGLCEQDLDRRNSVQDHCSMKDFSIQPRVLSLEESFKAFTESEELDEHNPWYCSQCRQNQPAKKTLKVCRFPETLVVYLKRFVFHQLTGIKIDSKVHYPLETLDVSALQDESCTSCPPTYDLQSCILHFGGVNAGHYTCFTKHPLSCSWRYYNDETVSQLQPSEEHANNVYVLFYQRKGTSVSFRLPSPLPVDRSATPSPPQSPCVPNLGSPNIMEDINDMLRDYSSTQGENQDDQTPFFGPVNMVDRDGLYNNEVTESSFPDQQEEMLKFDLYS